MGRSHAARASNIQLVHNTTLAPTSREQRRERRERHIVNHPALRAKGNAGIENSAIRASRA